jgi:hypothetical protein
MTQKFFDDHAKARIASMPRGSTNAFSRAHRDIALASFVTLKTRVR